MKKALRSVLIGTLCLSSAQIADAAENDATIARGAYLATVMDCGGCHMPRGADGAPVVAAGLSGGNVGFEIPGLGVFWASNLTSHETGLKDWTTMQIVDAIRTGMRPDGRMLAPAMPWPSFAALTDEDAEAIALYLQSLEPAKSTAFAPVEAVEQAKGPFYRVMMPQ